jgi:endogenous inhibitor of DNA gyrase (YacG/DUF329 family)
MALLGAPKGKPMYSVNCPKCGHSALEHEYGKPTEGSGLMSGFSIWIRYCWHPVPVEGKEGFYSFCNCQIDDKDYSKAGSSALIRVS